MNLTQGNIFWKDDMKIKYSYPYLTKDVLCDILVVGGGISGALSAYYQAKQGYKVVVIEKNLIGYSSTLENMGAMYSVPDTINYTKKNTNEIKRLDTLMHDAKTELGKIVEDMENNGCNLEYTECNFLNFSSKVTGKFALSKLYESELAKGKGVSLVEQNSVLDIYSAVEYKSQGIILNPYIFSQELIHMLSLMPNVEVYENTCAESINSKEQEVEVQTTNRFKIRASKVILATGVDMLKFLKEDMVEVYKSYNVVAKLKNDLKCAPFVARENGTEKIIRVTHTHAILNGEDIKSGAKAGDSVYEDKIGNGKYKKLYAVLSKLINIDNFKIKSCFYGLYLQTSDGLPVIDEIDNMPNVYCNLGVGKNGILHNVMGAGMLKNIYSDCYTKDMYMFRINR